MQDNYKAWDINLDDFNKQGNLYDRLKFLVKFAVLAPSSHNSQPWSFKIIDNKIFLKPELTRILPVSDPTHRQLFVSLGCALENLLVASDYYGFDCSVDYFPESNTEAVVSTLNGKDTKFGQKSHLASFISRRHNNRNKYQDKLPESNFVSYLKNLAELPLSINVVQDKNEKNAVADVVIKALLEAMDSPRFRQELSGYVKSNITKSKIGMPGFGMGMPTPVSLVAPTILKFFNMAKATRKQDEELLKKHTPMFLIVSTQKDDKENWVKAGQICERVALEAESKGIKTAIMAAAIEVGEYYKDLQKILNTGYRPQVFMRIGYCDEVTRHSPRLNVQDVCH